MEKFNNKTSIGNERAIKIGNFVPSKGAGLAYFSNKSLNPVDNLKIIDISDTIAENKILNQGETKILFANEMGILQDENGNTNLYSSDLTLSDTFLSKDFTTERIYSKTINPNDFLHYYYVSRYFVSAPSGYAINDLDDYHDVSYYKNINIKVVDSQNQEYLDKNTGRRKYKILLDPYLTESNSTNTEIPYRIIIGLDSSEPINLKLFYDKITLDEDGEVTSQTLRYAETINAVPYYSEVSEEASVVSKHSKKIYSIKKFNKKYSEIFSHNLDYSSYQIFVPRKALFDNRNYEVFNWRLVARVNQSVNYDIMDNSKDAEDSGEIKQRTVNVGVLYDSTDTTALENINPYVFYRLEKSGFNMSNYIFQNPEVEDKFWIQAEGIGKPQKSQAAYWMVDVQSVDSLEKFDILTFSPTNTLSQKATKLIDEYVTIKNGTLLVDASAYPVETPFVFSDIKVSAFSTQAVESYYEYIESSVLDEKKNGGWNIDSTIFNNDNYGIFGVKKATYKGISSVDASKAFLKVGITSTPNKVIGATFSFGSTGDKLSQGNIIFCSFSFLEYCNKVFHTNEQPNVLDQNSGPTVYEQIDYALMPGYVEGPFKLLYNSLMYSLYSRSQATRKIDLRPSLYNFVGPWESSWVMDQDVLMDDEKTKYFTNIFNTSGVVQYARDLIPDQDSLKKYYLKKITETLPSALSQQVAAASVVDNDTEFYLEITNPDVIIGLPSFDIGTLSETKISSTSLENFPSSYYIYKIVNKNQKIYAFTEKKSNKLYIPEGYGPYEIREMGEIKVGGNKTLNNGISPSSYFKSYPFRFGVRYSTISTYEQGPKFFGSTKTRLNLLYKAKGALRSVKVIGTVTRNYAGTNRIITHPAPDADPILIEGHNVSDVACTNIISGRQNEVSGRLPVISDLSAQNFKNFEYTWDIEAAASGYPIQTWRVGAKHPYVKYIKCVMQIAGLYNINKTSINARTKVREQPENNTTYTATLSAAVKQFQTKVKLGQLGAGAVPRVPLLYPPDGVVDSETKSLMAYVIKFWNKYEPIYYNNLLKLAEEHDVTRFVEAVFKQIEPSQINSGSSYRRISFTGNVSNSPSVIEDFIFFSIPNPESYQKVYKVRIKLEGAPWNKVKLVGYGYSAKDPIEGGQKRFAANAIYKAYDVHKATNGVTIVNNAIEIDLAGVSTAQCRNLFVRIQTNGKQLGGAWGNLAEGFGIVGITADLKTKDTTEPPKDAIEDVAFDYNKVHQAFPSIDKPEVEELASYWLLDQEGNPDPNLSWSGNKLVSSLNGHLIYTTLTNKFYVWDNAQSKWTEDIVSFFNPTPDERQEINPINLDLDEIERSIVYKDLIQTTDVYVNATAYLTEDFENLSSLSERVVDYSVGYLSGKNVLLNNFSYNYLGKSYSKALSSPTPIVETSLNNLLNESIATDPNAIETIQNNGLTINFANPVSVSIDVNDSVEIISFKSSVSGQAVNASSVCTLSYHGILPNNLTPEKSTCTGFKLKTSQTYYSGSNSYISDELIVDTYSIINTDGDIVEKINSVTVNDGLILLCDSSGKPVGIPSPESISDNIVMFNKTGITLNDISYGYVSINNSTYENDGLIYGLYDRVQKEFIGKLVSYNDIIARGINNIYIAAMAFDADGNLDKAIDYVGAQSTNTYKPITLSPKMIAPVYSVKYLNDSAIKVVEMSDYISRKEPWPLRITCGSFNKKIVISKNYAFSDWKTKYIGQVLSCTYDTSSSVLANNFSRIFGHKNKDIKNEIPLIISSKKIKLRRTPVLAYTMPIEDDIESVIPAVLPAITVYIRADESSSWLEIPFSEIKDVDAHNGIVEFKSQIVFSPELIKVDYTIKDNTIWIYQVEGEEIPLNPFLNKDKIDENKPLYIYLMPTKIDKYNFSPAIESFYGPKNKSLANNIVPVTEYANSYPVHFTYDKNIFNKLSHKYNPIALPIGVVYITNSEEQSSINIYDIRVKGGGVASDIASYSELNQIKGVNSYWDMQGMSTRTYPKGGYAVIKIPDAVKNNFRSIEEIYDIVNRNITAGIGFEIQNSDGVPWRTKEYE